MFFFLELELRGVTLRIADHEGHSRMHFNECIYTICLHMAINLTRINFNSDQYIFKWQVAVCNEFNL
jgi:hypothetical protein